MALTRRSLLSHAGGLAVADKVVGISALGDPLEYQASSGTALHDAIADLPTDGGEIYLPRDKVYVDHTLDIPTDSGTAIRLVGKGASWRGRNYGSVIESRITDGSPIISIPSTQSPSRGLYMEGFTVKGTGDDGVGIAADRWTQYGGARDVTVFGAGSHGWKITNSYTNRLIGCRGHSCGRNGFIMYASNNMTFLNCHGVGNGLDGFDLQGWAINLDNCGSGGNGANGYDLRSGGGFALDACHEERSGIDGYRIDTEATVLDACIANTGGRWNYHLNGAEQVEVRGCRSNYPMGDDNSAHIAIRDGCDGITVGRFKDRNGGDQFLISPDSTDIQSPALN